jgi:hypothetical protein
MRAYVRAMDSSPPPAPASACATLSLCCAAVLWGSGAVDSASLNCASCFASAMVVVAMRCDAVRCGARGVRGVRGMRVAGYVESV